MKRLVWMLPHALFVLLFLSMSSTGIPLIGRTFPVSATLPQGNLSSGEPLSSEATAAATQLAQDPLCIFHSAQAHWMGVASWILIPLAAIIPLSPALRNVRRKKLAVAVTLILILLVLILILLESFTGYFVGRMLRNPSSMVEGAFVRFVAVHSLALPVLLVLVLGLLSWVQARLAKRAASD